METSSPTTAGAACPPRALVLLLVSATSGRSLEHEATVVALHGRSIMTREIEVDASAADPGEGVNRLLMAIEATARDAALHGLRLGVWAERPQSGVALAAAARAPQKIQALVLIGAEADGRCDLPDDGPACLFVLAPGDFDQLERCREVCRRSPQRRCLSVLAGDDTALPVCSTELCAHKADLAARWFVDHLVVPPPLGKPPFERIGPSIWFASHLESLAPRHGERDGRL